MGLWEVYLSYHTPLQRFLERLMAVIGSGVVHGDISVANVTYDGEKTALLDFGLARYADGRNIRFSLDYARAANVLLYLLYSGYTGKGNRPWYEELSLSGEQKEFLKKLLDPEKVFEDACELKQRFQRCFAI